MPINTIYDYFSQQGKALPNNTSGRFSDDVFSKAAGAAGIDIRNYAGTAEQNNAIVANLNKNSTPTTQPTTQPPQTQKNTVSVTKYKDNPDGTTTNYLSDGTTSVVRYTKNPDGSLTPTEVGTEPTMAKIYNLNKAGFVNQDTQDAYNSQGNYYKGLANTNIDENAIRNNVLNEFQAEIDAQNSIFADKLAQAKVTGAGRIGQTTAINARRGLIGSDFGGAIKDNVTTENDKILQSIQNEKNAKLQEILSKARSTASDEIAAKRAAKEKGLDSYLTHLQGRDKRKQDNATTAATSIVAQGFSVDEIGDDMLKELATGYGVSIDDIKAQYAPAKAAYDQAQAEAKLKTKKTEADISKINADIAKGKYIQIGDGTQLYNIETGETIENTKDFSPNSGSGGSGNNTLTDNERALLTTFQNSPIVKNYNDVISQKLATDNIISNGVGGPADLAIVYSFMKGLDPNSVVRETEFATAAKSGNLFKGIYAKFNGYLKEEGGFLPENVRAQFQNLVNQKLGAQKRQYDNYAKNFKGIAVRQGLNPDNVVVDFSGALPTDGEVADDEEAQLKAQGYTDEQIQALKEAK